MSDRLVRGFTGPSATYDLDWAVAPAHVLVPVVRRPSPVLMVGLWPAVRYLERRDNAANVSLVTMALAGLAIMDVFGLRGRPHWTNQPDVGLLLAAVVVYLVWLATYSSVSVENKRGWATLFGRKDER